MAVDEIISLLRAMDTKLRLTSKLNIVIPFLLPHLKSPYGVGLAALSGYVLVCNVFRFRRVKNLERKYNKKEGERNGKVIVGRPDVTLTPQEMQEIMFTSLEYDMPGLMIYALTFALFKTYGIVSIV